MVCAKCGSANISVQMVQTGGKMSHNSRGCLWTCGRWMLILCTCGLWLLVGRSKGKSKQKFQNEKRAICQNCGNSWSV